MFSYFLSIPYYILFERPIKNILDLILFPKQSIFKKRKDVEEDSDEESETEEEDTNIETAPLESDQNEPLPP